LNRPDVGRFSLETMLPAKRLTAAVFLSLALSSCFSSARRISFGGEGRREATVELQSGEVRFATYFHGRDIGGAVARYDVELLQADRVVSRTSCDLLPVIDDRQCVFHFNQVRECNIVMKCSAHLDVGGPTLVRARLSISAKPKEFKLDRVDLIVGS
jgi:hypothetical protein